MAEQAEQQARAGQGQGESQLSIPADAMVILPVRQTVLFPGMV